MSIDCFLVVTARKDYPFDSTWQVYNWYTTISVIFRSLCDYIFIIMTARNYSDNCLQVRKELSPYWPILAEKLPEKLTEGKHLKFRYCSPFFCTYKAIYRITIPLHTRCAHVIFNVLFVDFYFVNIAGWKSLISF